MEMIDPGRHTVKGSSVGGWMYSSADCDDGRPERRHLRREAVLGGLAEHGE
jgi:hypothetical protein